MIKKQQQQQLNFAKEAWNNESLQLLGAGMGAGREKQALSQQFLAKSCLPSSGFLHTHKTTFSA